MKNYIIYAWDGESMTMEPFFVASKDIDEALEIFCASNRSKKKIIPESSLTEREVQFMKTNKHYKYIDSTDLGVTRGFLLIDKMLIKERKGGLF